jgi:hypothetical protein
MSRGGVDYMHLGAYYVISNMRLQIWMALVSACFALVYFAAVRLRHPLNNLLGIAHVVMVTIGYALFWVTLTIGISDIPPNPWWFLAIIVGMLGFLAGCALFSVNCAWAFRPIKRTSPA